MVTVEIKNIKKYKEVTIRIDNGTLVSGLLDEEESYDLALFFVDAAEELAGATLVWKQEFPNN